MNGERLLTEDEIKRIIDNLTPEQSERLIRHWSMSRALMDLSNKDLVGLVIRHYVFAGDKRQEAVLFELCRRCDPTVGQNA